jgi:AraC-like DNA-binding protein
MPLMKYLRLLKLEKAKELLLTTDKSVLDIAETVGFEDSNYFTAVFTNVFGLSPRAFRKSNE